MQSFYSSSYYIFVCLYVDLPLESLREAGARRMGDLMRPGLESTAFSFVCPRDKTLHTHSTYVYRDRQSVQIRQKRQWTVISN